MVGARDDTSNRVFLPTVLVRRQRRVRELARLRDARRKYRNPDRNHHSSYAAENTARNAKRDVTRTTEKLTAMFIMWDGESPQDSGYTFFANSVGGEILHPYLSTLECLQLIMDTALEYPRAVHISFGFNLDVSYILKDLPRRQLSALHTFNRCVWEDWQLQHIPHKWFEVRHGEQCVKIYDIHTFFPGGYVGALIQFGIGTEAERIRMAQEKAKRSEFLYKDIEEIADYCRLELRLGPLLGEALRAALHAGANYVPRSWHGPGAIARMALHRHKMYDCMAEGPPQVKRAARYAFAGGRFEQFLAGHAQAAVFEADINSAYPYYATLLPNLARGKWRYTRTYEAGTFGLWHIRYEAEYDRERPYPLFRRLKDQSICWPHRVEGWYHTPEAELVVNDPAARFLEGWVFDEDNPADRPFAWLTEYYRRRKVADRAGSIAAYTFKILINAVFGQLAQRTGWDRKRRQPPRSHQLEWAGFITSSCRAAVHKAAMQCGEKLVSINTDSVQALAPLDFLDVGSELGQWKLSEYEDGIFWQSGIYSLREPLGYAESLGYGWSKAKTRGIPKGSYTPEDMLECLATGEPLRLRKKVFVTYGLADSGRWDELNTWVDEPHEFKMGGSGTRRHNLGIKGAYCREICTNLHRLTQVVMEVHIEESMMSEPHWLPWLGPAPDNKLTMDDLMLFDANHLEWDDQWVSDYV